MLLLLRCHTANTVSKWSLSSLRDHGINRQWKMLYNACLRIIPPKEWRNWHLYPSSSQSFVKGCFGAQREVNFLAFVSGSMPKGKVLEISSDSTGHIERGGRKNQLGRKLGQVLGRIHSNKRTA